MAPGARPRSHLCPEHDDPLPHPRSQPRPHDSQRVLSSGPMRTFGNYHVHPRRLLPVAKTALAGQPHVTVQGRSGRHCVLVGPAKCACSLALPQRSERARGAGMGGLGWGVRARCPGCTRWLLLGGLAQVTSLLSLLTEGGGEDATSCHLRMWTSRVAQR